MGVTGSRRITVGRPDGVQGHVVGRHPEAHNGGIPVGKRQSCCVPGREGQAVFAARLDGNVRAFFVLINPGGGSVAAGIADGHLIHCLAGLLTAGDFNGIRRCLAFIANGEDLIFRRAGGIKAADHICRDRDRLFASIGIHGLNRQVCHIQSLACLIFGLVGDAVDGNGL